MRNCYVLVCTMRKIKANGQTTILFLLFCFVLLFLFYKFFRRWRSGFSFFPGRHFNRREGENMAREFAKAFYKSKEWQMTREYVLRRDNYLCVKCGRPAEEVHHIKHLSPSNIYDPAVTMNPDNLASLCKDCHFAEHKADKAAGHRKQAIPGTEYTFDNNGMVVPVEAVKTANFEG